MTCPSAVAASRATAQTSKHRDPNRGDCDRHENTPRTPNATADRWSKHRDPNRGDCDLEPLSPAGLETGLECVQVETPRPEPRGLRPPDVEGVGEGNRDPLPRRNTETRTEGIATPARAHPAPPPHTILRARRNTETRTEGIATLFRLPDQLRHELRMSKHRDPNRGDCDAHLVEHDLVQVFDDVGRNTETRTEGIATLTSPLFGVTP